jgi:heme/copper-type cytochrome/quinol oxidase subunit 1
LKWNVMIGFAAWGLGLFQIPFIINFFTSIKWGKLVDRNPWEATTLEWSAPSPPGHGAGCQGGLHAPIRAGEGVTTSHEHSVHS